MSFVQYYPKASAGIGCGFIGNGVTSCKLGFLFMPTPPSDGTSSTPANLTLGAVPGVCSASSIATTSAPTTIASNSTQAPSKSSANVISSTFVSTLLLLVALNVIIFQG